MLTPGCLAPETDSGSGNQAPLSPRSFQGGHPYQLNSTPGKPRLGACAELPRVMGRGLQSQGGLGRGPRTHPSVLFSAASSVRCSSPRNQGRAQECGAGVTSAHQG